MKDLKAEVDAGMREIVRAHHRDLHVEAAIRGASR